MNKKLKRIKSQMKYWQDCPGESYSVSESTFEWLIEQAEREVSHSNKINKLHFFLDNNVADLASERCGHHVIDVAIYVIKKQVERAQELELEVSELQRAYNDSQKEIVVLKNKIKALINKYEV